MTWTQPDPTRMGRQPQRPRRCSRRRRELVSLDPDDLPTRHGGPPASPTSAATRGARTSRRSSTRSRTRPPHAWRAGCRPHRGAAALRQRLLLAELWRTTRRSSTSRSKPPCSWSAPDGRAPRSSTSCSPSTPPTGCRSPGSCSTPARRSARTPAEARRAGNATTRSGPTCSPATPRCTTTTATSRTSASSPRCSSSSPTSGPAPTRCRATPHYMLAQDHTEAYRYHRRVLQTLQRRGPPRPLGAQGPEPPRADAHAVRGVPRRSSDPDPPRSAQVRPVDHQPDGHAALDALRRRSTSKRSCRSCRWATD